MNRDPMTLPGSLALSLADAEMWKLLGLRVDARDLGGTRGLPAPRVPTAEAQAVLAHGDQQKWVAVSPNLEIETDEAYERRTTAYNAAYTETTDQGDGGSDADDWDVDDNSPANNPAYWDGLAEANEASDLRLTEAAGAALKRAGLHDAAHTYHVHNPFTGLDAWFRTADDARAYARAASDADHIDGDFGVWSAAGFGDGEYWLYRKGGEYSEADPDEVTTAVCHADARHALPAHPTTDANGMRFCSPRCRDAWARYLALERHGYEAWRAEQTPQALAEHDARLAARVAAD